MKFRLIYQKLFLVLWMFTSVNGHGRLLEPPSRSSLFRFIDTDPVIAQYENIIVPNYNDNELYCGGRSVQIANNGKCGVCGDAYSDEVKENEAGGTYALGIITRNYTQGDLINVTVQITAEHKGYFEFRLCPWNNVNIPITHECLNQNLLEFQNAETKWYLPKTTSEAVGYHHLQVQLPQEITCTQCVLQWRYRTGNSWGTENGQQGLGLGQQEEFYGCSDIGINAYETLGSITLTSSLPTSSFSATTREMEESPNTESNVEEVEPKTEEDILPSTATSTKITTTEKSTTTTTATTISTLQSTISIEPIPDIDCSQAQLGLTIYRDCHSFFICAFSFLSPYIYACPEGTVCDPSTGRCLHPVDVPSCA